MEDDEGPVLYDPCRCDNYADSRHSGGGGARVACGVNQVVSGMLGQLERTVHVLSLSIRVNPSMQPPASRRVAFLLSPGVAVDRKP